MSTRPTESEREAMRRLVYQAREEDLGGGDVTGRLIPPEIHATGQFVARQPLVVCGGTFLDAIAKAYDESIQMILWKEEGQAVEAGEVIAEWFGPAWHIVAAERVALNFLQHLCGVATITRQYVEAVATAGAGIYDTRKTIPGWRDLEKYAVRVGGGKNHRRGLHDAILVKDNHLAAVHLHDLGERLSELRQDLPYNGFVEIEVDTLEQLAEALKLPVDVILLDNMGSDKLRQAVKMRAEAGKAADIHLEASGGMTLENIAEVARTGVERIAVGAITHSAPAVDIGLDLELRSDEA
jgi:nicotinate-nucleotide pyrophosphorylase (carboxylating)